MQANLGNLETEQKESWVQLRGLVQDMEKVSSPPATDSNASSELGAYRCSHAGAAVWQGACIAVLSTRLVCIQMIECVRTPTCSSCRVSAITHAARETWARSRSDLRVNAQLATHSDDHQSTAMMQSLLHWQWMRWSGYIRTVVHCKCELLPIKS